MVKNTIPSIVADATQKDWIRVCKKLGLKVNTNYGNGSHVRVYSPENPVNKPLTIQKSNLNKITNKKIFSQIAQLGFEKEEIIKALK